MGDAKQGRKIKVYPRGDMPLHARPDQENICTWGAAGLLVVILHFNSRTQLVIQKRVADALARGEFRVVWLAQFLFTR